MRILVLYCVELLPMWISFMHLMQWTLEKKKTSIFVASLFFRSCSCQVSQAFRLYFFSPLTLFFSAMFCELQQIFASLFCWFAAFYRIRHNVWAAYFHSTTMTDKSRSVLFECEKKKRNNHGKEWVYLFLLASSSCLKFINAMQSYTRAHTHLHTANIEAFWSEAKKSDD